MARFCKKQLPPAVHGEFRFVITKTIEGKRSFLTRSNWTSFSWEVTTAKTWKTEAAARRHLDALVIGQYSGLEVSGIVYDLPTNEWI